jgi:hypothetical protein
MADAYAFNVASSASSASGYLSGDDLDEQSVEELRRQAQLNKERIALQETLLDQQKALRKLREELRVSKEQSGKVISLSASPASKNARPLHEPGRRVSRMVSIAIPEETPSTKPTGRRDTLFSAEGEEDDKDEEEQKPAETGAPSRPRPPALHNLVELMEKEIGAALRGKVSSQQETKFRRGCLHYNMRISIIESNMLAYEMDLDKNSNILMLLCDSELKRDFMDTNIQCGKKDSWGIAKRWIRLETLEPMGATNFRRKLYNPELTSKPVNQYYGRGVSRAIEDLIDEGADYYVSVDPHQIHALWTTMLTNSVPEAYKIDILNAVQHEWAQNEDLYLSGIKTHLHMMDVVVAKEDIWLQAIALASKGKKKTEPLAAPPTPAGTLKIAVPKQSHRPSASGNAGPSMARQSGQPAPLVKDGEYGKLYRIGTGNYGQPQNDGCEGCRHPSHQARDKRKYTGHKESEHKDGTLKVASPSQGYLAPNKTYYMVSFSGIPNQSDQGTDTPHSQDDILLVDSGSSCNAANRDHVLQAGAHIWQLPAPETYAGFANDSITFYEAADLSIKAGSTTAIIRFLVTEIDFGVPYLMAGEQGPKLGFTEISHPELQPLPFGYQPHIKLSSAARIGAFPLPEHLKRELEEDRLRDEHQLDDHETHDPVKLTHTDDTKDVFFKKGPLAGKLAFKVGTYYNEGNVPFYDQLVDSLLEFMEVNQQAPSTKDAFPRVGHPLKPGLSHKDLPHVTGTRVPRHMEPVVQKLLDGMVERGEICVVQPSPDNFAYHNRQTASVRVMFKAKKDLGTFNLETDDPSSFIRMLNDCRQVNKCIDMSRFKDTRQESLEQIAEALALFNVFYITDMSGGFQQFLIRYIESCYMGKDGISDEEVMHQDEFAIEFTVNDRTYRWCTVLQGAIISMAVFGSNINARDPVTQLPSWREHHKVYVDDNSGGTKSPTIRVDSIKLSKARSSSSNYDDLSQFDILADDNSKPSNVTEMFDMRPYYLLIRDYFLVQNGKYGTKQKPAKSRFLLHTMVVGGIKITDGTLSMNDDQVFAVANIAMPRSRMDLRKVCHYFLYFNRFAPGIAAAMPTAFKWMASDDKGPLLKAVGQEDHDLICNEIRDVQYRLVTAKSLKAPDPAKEFVLVTDSSSKSNAATLSQTEHRIPDDLSIEELGALNEELRSNVIGHYSIANKPGDVKKGAGFLELNSILDAIEHFWPKIAGKTVTVMNDNKPAIYALTHDKEPTDQVWRRLNKLNKLVDIRFLWVQGSVDIGCVDSGSRLEFDDRPDTFGLLGALRDPGPVLPPPVPVGTIKVSTRSKQTMASSSSGSMPSSFEGASSSSSNINNNDTGNAHSEKDKGSAIDRSTPKRMTAKRSHAGYKDDDYFAIVTNNEPPDRDQSDYEPISEKDIQPWIPELTKDGLLILPSMSHNLRDKFEAGTLFSPPIEYRQELLELCHGLSGHYGINQMREHLWRNGFLWIGFDDDAKAFKQRCIQCIRHDVARRRYNEISSKIYRSPQSGHSIVTDTGTFPIDSKGMTTVSGITDVLTGLTTFKALPSKSASDCILHLKEWVSVFGPFARLGADNSYDNSEIRSFTDSICAKLSNSAPFYPQGNGAAEDAMKHSKTLLAKLAEEDPVDWSDKIWLVNLIVNNNLRTRTGMTPYYAAFHHHPVLPGERPVEFDSLDQAVEELKRRIKEDTPIEMAALHMRLDKYSELREKRFASRPVQKISEGDWVARIDSNPVARKTSTVTEGPYEVAAVLSTLKVLLYDNNEKRGILKDGNGHHILTHTSWLKKVPPPAKYELLRRPMPSSSLVPNSASTPQATMGIQTTKTESSTPTGGFDVVEIVSAKRQNGRIVYRVKWTDTWEPAKNLDPSLIDDYNRRVNTKGSGIAQPRG